MNKKLGKTAAWVEYEIQANIDSYDNTELEAAEFVLDMLNEGQYEDLSDWAYGRAKVLVQHRINALKAVAV